MVGDGGPLVLGARLMGHNPLELAWTEKDIEKLCRLWVLEINAPGVRGARGQTTAAAQVRKLSASEIALQMPGRTKNSIIGKVRRLAAIGKLTHRPSPLKHELDPTLHRARDYARARARRMGLTSLPKLKSLEKPMPKVRADNGARALSDAERSAAYRARRKADLGAAAPKPAPVLRFRQPPLIGATPCRWPLNDCRPWLFCEEPSNWDRPYCEKHCQVAYRPRFSLTTTTETMRDGFASF